MNDVYKKIHDKLLNIKDENDYLRLFDTSNMDLNQIIKFLEPIINSNEFNEFFMNCLNLEPSNYIKYFKLKNNDRTYSMSDINFFKLFIKYFCMFYVGKSKLYGSRVHINNELTIKMLNRTNENECNESLCLYRGLNDINYKLIPSCFRNDKLNGFTDLNELSKYYGFENIIDYRYLAISQHSEKTSPLLDFTSDINVAVSFASHDEKQNDSCIYCIQIRNTKEEICNVNHILKHKFRVLKIDMIKVGECETYKGKKYDFSTIKKIIDNLSPKHVFVDTETIIETNKDDNLARERMNRQKGYFLLFYDYVIVGGRILFQLSKHLDMFRYTIKADEKIKLYDQVKDKYSYGYLMCDVLKKEGVANE